MDREKNAVSFVNPLLWVKKKNLYLDILEQRFLNFGH